MTVDLDSELLNNFQTAPTTIEEPTLVSKIEVPVAQVQDEQPTQTAPKIIQMNSALYGALVGILKILQKDVTITTVLEIREGHLQLISGNGRLFCDLTDILGDGSFSLIDIKSSTAKMGLIKGGGDINIIDDTENQKYLISKIIDGIVTETIILNKPEQDSENVLFVPPTGTVLTEVILSQEEVQTIQDASITYDSDTIKIVLNNVDEVTNIASISAENTSENINYTKTFSTLDGTKTEFKSFGPFPIKKVDEVEVIISKDENDIHWITTNSTTGMVRIKYIERLQPIEEFDTWDI